MQVSSRGCDIHQKIQDSPESPNVAPAVHPDFPGLGTREKLWTHGPSPDSLSASLKGWQQAVPFTEGHTMITPLAQGTK